MDTLRLIEPDLLVVVTWLMEVIGVICTAIGLVLTIRKGWSAERLLSWMVPAMIAQSMEHFGWTPLLMTGVVMVGAWLWVRHQNRALDPLEA